MEESLLDLETTAGTVILPGELNLNQPSDNDVVQTDHLDFSSFGSVEIPTSIPSTLSPAGGRPVTIHDTPSSSRGILPVRTSGKTSTLSSLIILNGVICFSQFKRSLVGFLLISCCSG